MSATKDGSSQVSSGWVLFMAWTWTLLASARLILRLLTPHTLDHVDVWLAYFAYPLLACSFWFSYVRQRRKEKDAQ